MADEGAAASPAIASFQQATDQERQEQHQAAGSATNNNAAGESQETTSNVSGEANQHDDNGQLNVTAAENKEGKGSKKPASPIVTHSYASLTVQERQARAEKLRQQKVLDLKKKEKERRAAFEERRKKLLAEENAKRTALLKKLESTSPKATRVPSRGSFGSSPRPFSASTSNLSHLRQARNVSRSIDISSPNNRAKTGSFTAKDDLPKRPSSAMHRPRSSLYHSKQQAAPADSSSGTKSATLGGRSSSARLSSARPTQSGRPQSAFGSCTARGVAEKPRVPAATSKPPLRKNLQPSAGTKAKPAQERARSLSSLASTTKTTTKTTTRAKTPSTKPASKSSSKTSPATKSSRAEAPAEEKKKVIRRAPGTAKATTTTTKTTTTIKTNVNAEEKHVDKDEVTSAEPSTTVVAISVTSAADEEAEREAKQRDELAAAERARKEREEQEQADEENRRKEEERERKAKEELERRAAEREHNKKIEEEARQERKKRVEMIMAKVAGKKDGIESAGASPGPAVAAELVPEPVEEQVRAVSPDPETTKQRVDKILQRVKVKDGAGTSSDSGGEMSPDDGTLSPREPMEILLPSSHDDLPPRVDVQDPVSSVDKDMVAVESSDMQPVNTDVTISSALSMAYNGDEAEEVRLHDGFPEREDLSTSGVITINNYDERTDTSTLVDHNDKDKSKIGNSLSTSLQDTSHDHPPPENVETLWKTTEQTMANTLNNGNQDGLDILLHHNKGEEGKLWQVAEGQLELSECF